MIVFEVTETALLHDEAAGIAFGERMAELGCGLALDDFGTATAASPTSSACTSISSRSTSSSCATC